MDAYEEGWRAFEDGKKESDNPYKKAGERHPDYYKKNGWSYGWNTRKDIRTATGR